MEDVAAAFETILIKGRIGETYNIGTQKERTVLDVAHDIAKVFNLPSNNITHVRDRAFNDQRCAPCHPCFTRLYASFLLDSRLRTSCHSCTLPGAAGSCKEKTRAVHCPKQQPKERAACSVAAGCRLLGYY